MAEFQPDAPRYTIEDSFAALRIAIPARRHWLVVLFLGFWLAGWATGELFVAATLVEGLAAILAGRAPDMGSGAGLLFIGIWLALWTVGGGFALLVWLWNLAGKEVVVIDGESLTIQKAVLGIGPRKRYEAAYVDRLRVSEDYGGSRGPWAGALTFDYGGSAVRFGAGLTPVEARNVLARIADRFPSLSQGLE